jgi:hypothetical protein
MSLRSDTLSWLRQPGFALQYISITLRSCPTYDIDPKIHTIVSNHIWVPSLDLYQVSWTYGFSKTKVQLYTGMTMSISFMSEAANLLEHISSFLVYDIHSQSECSVLCYTRYPVLYLLWWFSLYTCTNFHSIHISWLYILHVCFRLNA